MMKKKLYIGFAVAALLSAGCDNFLEVSSPSLFDANYVFSSTGDAEKMLLGSYACFTQDPYTSRMSNVWMQNTDVEASGVQANTDGSRRDIWSLQAGLVESWGDISKGWSNCQLAIDRANQCIEGILSSSLVNDPYMQQMLGEAYCLRAYHYWLMCNYWGDVPYFREAAKAGMELDVPRTDKNIIYSGMIQDLVNCESKMYLAAQSTAGIERMNREYCIGFIARLAMFRAGYGMTAEGVMKRADEYLDVQGNPDLAVTYTIEGVTKTARTSQEYYQLASDYCQYLMKISPRDLGDFQTVFENQSRWVKPVDGDILYEVAFAPNQGGDVGWCIGQEVTKSSFGKTTIQLGFPITYYYSFDEKDLRLPVTVAMVKYVDDNMQEPKAINQFNCGKWNRMLLPASPGSESSKSTGINWPVLRYSDVLLMLAEAENEIHSGPTAIAKEAFTQVRSRAFAPEDQAAKVNAYIAALGSYDDFFNAIVDERAWEFGGECLRKFDLGRWNIYGKKIKQTRDEMCNIAKAMWDGYTEGSDPEVDKYLNYADVVYYTVDKGVVKYLNSRYKLDPIEVPADGDLHKDYAAAQKANDGKKYVKLNWCKNLLKDEKVENKDESGKVISVQHTYVPADFVCWTWRGYTDDNGVAAVPYLLPIGAATVATSKHLNNNGYGHVKNATAVWQNPVFGEKSEIKE